MSVQPEAVSEYLVERRMCSVENLAFRFNTSIETVWQAVKSLEESGKIRVSQSKCSSGCSSCDTTNCATSTIDATAIIISLMPRTIDHDSEEC